ncbi:hypothetical protein [Spirosoma humi]
MMCIIRRIDWFALNERQIDLLSAHRSLVVGFQNKMHFLNRFNGLGIRQTVETVEEMRVFMGGFPRFQPGATKKFS